MQDSVIIEVFAKKITLINVEHVEVVNDYYSVRSKYVLELFEDTMRIFFTKRTLCLHRRQLMC